MGAVICCGLSGNQLVYSVPIGQEKKGQTKIHRHPQSVDGLLKVPQNIRCLSEFWDQILSKYSQNKAVQDYTYKEVDAYAKAVGSWMVQNKHTKIYLYAKNRPQWTITDIACWNYGQTNIPLYDTLGVEAFFHIIKLTEGTAIFMINDLTVKLAANLSKQKEKINTVVFLDIPSEENFKMLQSLGLKVFLFKDLMNNNKIKQRPRMNLDHHITYSFTSGTTGLPKGVIGTHRATIAQCMAMKGHYEYNQTDVHLSFLPVAHSFERFITWTVLYFGGNIQYSKHSILQLTKDLTSVKPTTIGITPRLLNRLYPICKGILQNQGNTDKIKDMFGGRCRKMIIKMNIGFFPIDHQVLSFFKGVLNCDIRQGYGQSLLSVGSFINNQRDNNHKNIGGPNRAVQFKLVDIPQMNYFTSASIPTGQVYTRGDSIFIDYDQNNTKQTTDLNKWNHSGDIGMLLPNGALKVIDKKEKLLRLNKNQHLPLQQIQHIYTIHEYIEQCVVYKSPQKSYNIAIIYPNIKAIKYLTKYLDIGSQNEEQNQFQSIISNKQIQQLFLQQISDFAKQKGLLDIELIKKIRLWPNSFQKLGIYTKEKSIKREIAYNVFKKQIQQLYKSQQLPQKASGISNSTSQLKDIKQKAKQIQQYPVIPSIAAHFKSEENIYNKLTNPQGYVNFGVSINLPNMKQIIKYFPKYIKVQNCQYSIATLQKKLNQILSKQTSYGSEQIFVMNNLVTVVAMHAQKWKKVSYEGSYKQLDTVISYSFCQIVSFEQSSCHILFYPQKDRIKQCLQTKTDKRFLIVVSKQADIIKTDKMNVFYAYQKEFKYGMTCGVCLFKDKKTYQDFQFPFLNLQLSTFVSATVQYFNQNQKCQQSQNKLMQIYKHQEIKQNFIKMLGIENIQGSNNKVFCTIGAGSGLTNLGVSIFQKDDRILLEKPYYFALIHDFHKSGIKFQFKNVFQGTLLTRAQQSYKNGMKGYLIVNPHNPTGKVQTQSQVREVCEWAKNTPNFHLIFDQMYYNSIYEQNCKTLSGIQYALKYQNIHVIRGFAKDFSLCGWKIGLLISCNQNVYKNFNKWQTIISPQKIVLKAVSKMVKQTNYGKQVFEKARYYLKNRTELTIKNLQKNKIKYIKPEGGCFIIIDFRDIMKQKGLTQTGIWLKLFYEYKVNINLGKTHGFDEQGYFRMCHIINEESIEQGIDRIGKFMRCA